ncbi:MAG: putative ferredoxin [Friedmanniella sp.]|nr:putative ferredoxin [Friedmanniella sp.]
MDGEFGFTADVDVCIGGGMCVMAAPRVFDQSEDEGLVVVLDQDPPPAEHDAVREAARLCPSGAITVRG